MKRLILVLVVFVLVATPLSAGIWTLIVPKYEARGEVRVRPIVPRLVFQTDENGVIPFYDAFVNTQAALLRSPTVLQRVLDQPEIQKTPWYKNPPKTLRQRWGGDAAPALERLRTGLSVEPRSQTEIIDVSFADPSAQDAKLIVDAILQQYLQYLGQRSNDTEEKLYRELTSQYHALEAEIKAREAICFNLGRQLGTATPRELLSRRSVRLDETQARLNELRHRVATLTWKMKETDGSSPAASSRRKPKYHEDAEWRKLDIAVRTFRHHLESDQVEANDPAARRAQKDLEFAQELLRLREAQLDEQWDDQVKDLASREDGPVPLEPQLALARQEEQLLRSEWEEQQEELGRLFECARSLERENADLQHKRQLYDAVRQRLDQKNIERNVPGMIEVAPADCPSKPSQDPRLPFTAGAMLLGLCAAGSTAVLTRRRKNIPAGSDGPTGKFAKGSRGS